MRFGVCAKFDDLGGVAGLDYIEGTVEDLLCPQKDESAFAARLKAIRASAIPVEAACCFLPGSLKSTGPAVDEAALDRFVATAMDRAGRAGVKVVVYGSGGSRQVPEGWAQKDAIEQVVGHLKRWAPLAGRAGVTIVLEPLQSRECNFVNSVDQGAEIVRRVDQPSIRLLADTYHMVSDGEGPDSIRRAGKLLAHVHCAEGKGRGPLGTVGEDHRPYFRALKDIGYDGRISIEAKWGDQRAQLPAALAELRRQCQTA